MDAQAARGVHGSTYNKALASLKTFTPDQVAEMEDAAAYLKQPQGALLGCNPQAIYGSSVHTLARDHVLARYALTQVAINIEGCPAPLVISGEDRQVYPCCSA